MLPIYEFHRHEKLSDLYLPNAIFACSSYSGTSERLSGSCFFMFSKKVCKWYHRERITTKMRAIQNEEGLLSSMNWGLACLMVRPVFHFALECHKVGDALSMKATSLCWPWPLAPLGFEEEVRLLDLLFLLLLFCSQGCTENYCCTSKGLRRS